MNEKSCLKNSLHDRIRSFGYWSAIISTILTIAFAVLAFIFTPPEWQGIEAYASAFKPVQMLNFIPVLLLPPTIIVLMTSIHFFASDSKKIFSFLGVCFAIVYTVIISLNYYIQLFVVRLNIQSGETTCLEILAMPNLHSVFFALEAIGYGFLGLATLFLAQVFTNGKLENLIRALFIINGVLGIMGAIISLFDMPYVIFAALGIWCITFPMTAILLSIFFKKNFDSASRHK